MFQEIRRSIPHHPDDRLLALRNLGETSEHVDLGDLSRNNSKKIDIQVFRATSFPRTWRNLPLPSHYTDMLFYASHQSVLESLSLLLVT